MSEPSGYVGLWRDFSQGGAHQLTLTLTSNWGGYLISALALLVSLAGSSLWNIIAYTLHQFRVSQKNRHDPIHLQVQTLLRNSVSAISAITDAWMLSRAWYGTSIRIWRRVIPVITLASLCLVLFALAGTFVSGVATSNDARINILAEPKVCGGWYFNWTALHLRKEITDPEEYMAISDDIREARLYAKWFYGDYKPLSMPGSMFPIESLPYTTKMQPCPFKGENRCLTSEPSSPNQAMSWDSGLLDSHIHLGVNAPVEDRVQIRKILTCSPVNVDDLTSSSETGRVVMVDYTRLVNTNITKVFNTEPNKFPTGYEASCVWWPGVAKSDGWAAKPFDRDDIDLSICFISQNSVGYNKPVHDPLFLANGSKILNVSETQTAYFGNNYFNTIACQDQIQFCNERAGKCTNVTHAAAAFFDSQNIDLNLNQELVVNRTAMLLGLTTTAELGVGSLLVRDLTFSEVISAPLPSNQWQKEAQLWFETGLAMLQAHTIRFLGRIDLSSPLKYGRYLTYRPLDELRGAERDAVVTNCHSQKFTPTSGYQNFRFFELMLVVSVCLGLIILNLQGQVIAAYLNRPGDVIGLTACLTIPSVVLGPVVAQTADYWGRKWFVVIFSLLGAVGCVIVSRADSFAMFIAGTTITGLEFGVLPLLHTVPSEILPRRWRAPAQAAIMIANSFGLIIGLILGGIFNWNGNTEGFRNYYYIAMALFALATGNS
ncbi:hypothetical protein ACJZ2D_013573 [Fusarium nematophilum]